MKHKVLMILLIAYIFGYSVDNKEDYKLFCQVVDKLAGAELKVLELDSEKALAVSSLSYLKVIKEKQTDAESILSSIKDDLSTKLYTTEQQYLRFARCYFRILKVMLESDNPALLEPKLRAYADELKSVTKDSKIMLSWNDKGDTQQAKELDRDNRKVFEDQGLDIIFICNHIVFRNELLLKPAIDRLEKDCTELLQLQNDEMVDQIAHTENTMSARDWISLRHKTLFLKENLPHYMNELRQIEVISSQLKNELDLLFDGKASIDNLKIILVDLDSINEVLEELDKL